MQIQAAEADVDATLQLIVAALARVARHRPRLDGAGQRGRADARHAGRRRRPDRAVHAHAARPRATASAVRSWPIGTPWWWPTTPASGRPPRDRSATRSWAKASARCSAARCSRARRSSARSMSAAGGRSSSSRSRSPSSPRSPRRARSRSRTAASTRRSPQQNRLLEGSFAIHRTLTEAALTGAGRAHICVELARLLGCRGRARAGHLTAVSRALLRVGHGTRRAGRHDRHSRRGSRSRRRVRSRRAHPAAGQGARARGHRARAGARQGARTAAGRSGSCRATS